jgi:hypothetical protein
MKKIYMFLIVLAVLFVANSVLATVGGPTFIYNFKYNPTNESVYYIINSESGRGCPPELTKLSLNSGESQVVYSCDQGEKLLQSNGYNISAVDLEIEKIITNFKDLTPINLKNNRISIDISFVNFENIGPEIAEVKKANFVASVYQDNKKIIDLPISGCNLEQPFIFAGYAIPGFDKKIVLLLSTKGDCWEGGYIYETLHVVGGVSNLNKTSLNFYKGSSALVPNEGTLVVFESETVENKTKEIPVLQPDALINPLENKKDYTTLYVIIGAVFVLGLGYVLGRKIKI